LGYVMHYFAGFLLLSYLLIGALSVAG
jgi:hypothetical protein